MFETYSVVLTLATLVPGLLTLSYIQNHIKLHEYSVKTHDPRPRINKHPL